MTVFTTKLSSISWDFPNVQMYNDFVYVVNKNPLFHAHLKFKAKENTRGYYSPIDSKYESLKCEFFFKVSPLHFQ